MPVVRIAFVGYGSADDLEAKHGVVFPAFELAGYREIIYQGDQVHVVPAGAEERISKFVEQLNEHLPEGGGVTVNFEDIDLD